MAGGVSTRLSVCAMSTKKICESGARPSNCCSSGASAPDLSAFPAMLVATCVPCPPRLSFCRLPPAAVVSLSQRKQQAASSRSPRRDDSPTRLSRVDRHCESERGAHKVAGRAGKARLAPCAHGSSGVSILTHASCQCPASPQLPPPEPPGKRSRRHAEPAG
eukprot:768203-Hanusia_phi.AAC.6